MAKVQADQYWKVHQDCGERLGHGYDREKKQGRINQITHKRCYIAALNAGLDAVLGEQKSRGLKNGMISTNIIRCHCFISLLPP